MQRLLYTLVVVSLIVISAYAPLTATAARLELPTILVDLSHGQNSNGVCAMMSAVPDAYWVVVLPSEDALSAFPESHAKCIMQHAYKIVFGDIATALSDSELSIDMIIIGQPIYPLSDAEKEAIASWLGSATAKALWCATDSDYPAQGGAQEAAQHICNDLLDYLAESGFPVKLRSDYVSVEDPSSCAKRSYRVIAYVEPPARYDAELLKFGAEKVLMHGPGAVAWVDENGDWHKVTDPNTPENIIPIIVTTEEATIVEHQASGATEMGYAHMAGERGKFVLMAAEILETENGRKVIIVSGESPYFGYQSMLTFEYYGYLLDGPRFFRNLILWATGNYAELKAFKALEETVNKAVEEVAKTVETVTSQIDQLKSYVDNALAVQDSKVKSLENALNTVKADVDGVKSDLASVRDTASSASSKASNAMVLGAGGIILGLIALIAAALALRKK
ncbi:hypothetical protein [Hyperthermus butylicus]|uniref:Conserved archaeal protein n=1 Tax=Hyperthermus butylicus (strain DSM 5456 / JCM 9403 / PLM1-5) TaxID=415426 RepID=A2BIY4_HYPBU|nr:hypothetical protein [Hyperthermus butylicus]ABM79945.1 conserved archaeal protein [Hyperthermus butylicus DSM 5456]